MQKASKNASVLSAAAVISVSPYPACLAYVIYLDLFLSTSFVGPQSFNKTKPTIEHWHMCLPLFHIHADVLHFLA